MGRHSQVFKNAFNPFMAVDYIRGMVNDFGTKFTLLCVSNYFGIKGALDSFVGSVQITYWSQGGWNNVDYANANATISIPWSIKGFPAIFTDLMPILGYEKTTYFVFFTFMGAISCLILALFTFTKTNIDIAIPTIFFLFINFQTSFSDLYMEGKYADLMKKNLSNKGNVISFTYFGVTLGGLLPATTIGPMSDANILVKTQFWVYLPFAIQPLIFLFFGCMVNDKASPERNNKFDVIKFKKQVRPTIMAFMMGVVGTGTVMVNIFSNSTGNFLYNLIGGIVLGIIIWFTLPKTLAKVLYYIYMAMFTYLRLDSHLDFFYTLECVENGPHFSTTYYRTYVGYIKVVSSLIGIWLFQAILCQYKFRPIFWTSTVIRCIGSIFDIIMINRWNVDIGISDRAMYIIGSAIVYQICYQLDYMPIALMCAKVCPKSIETILFSIAAGYGNYGAAVSSFVGTFIIEGAGITLSQAGPCNVDGLAWIVFGGHCILPLICIPLTFLLIPDKYVNDNFADPAFHNLK